MRYVKTDGAGNVLVWPYSLSRLREEANASFAADPPDSLLASFDVYPVLAVERPVVDLAYNLIEGMPTLSNSVWTQTWDTEDATVEQIAQRQTQAVTDAERTDAEQDAWIVAYLAMTPAEAEQYVLDQVTNLATTKSVMSKLAYAVRVLIRRELGQ